LQLFLLTIRIVLEINTKEITMDRRLIDQEQFKVLKEAIDYYCREVGGWEDSHHLDNIIFVIENNYLKEEK
jgi:hypothetical protein